MGLRNSNEHASVLWNFVQWNLQEGGREFSVRSKEDEAWESKLCGNFIHHHISSSRALHCACVSEFISFSLCVTLRQGTQCLK
jgi:hypothetical protein